MQKGTLFVLISHSSLVCGEYFVVIVDIVFKLYDGYSMFYNGRCSHYGNRDTQIGIYLTIIIGLVHLTPSSFQTSFAPPFLLLILRSYVMTL